MKYLILLPVMWISLAVQSQQMIIDWDAAPKPHVIDNASFLKESAIIIQEDLQFEIKRNPLNNDLDCARRTHKVIRMNDEKGIEMYNKIKVGYSEKYPITNIKARTITASGKIIELKSDAFKEVKDEDGSMSKIFALEGVEKGSEIEYIVYQKSRFLSFGTDYLQDAVPTVLTRFELICPSNLIYDVKGYNGVKVSKDTIMDTKRSVMAQVNNLAGLEEEKYASYFPHFARVEYALAYNTESKGKGIRLFTWDDVADGLQKASVQFTEKEIKAGKKLLEDQKDFKKLNTTKEKIEWIEHFVKTNYQQQEYIPDEKSSEIEFTLKNKLTDESGIRNLFALLYFNQGINVEIGYTISRFIKPFDYSFINIENLKNCIFYFPETKQYMAPNEIFYRIPFIPSVWCNNDGVFTKVIKMGDLVKASAEKRKIPEISAEKNYHNHDVEVTFNSSMDTSLIRITNTFGGYNMLETLPAFVFLEGEKRDDAAKEIIRVSEKDEKIDQFKYENNDYKMVSLQQPMKISAVIHATNNIEKAGPKYLFKVGELIGRQAEMYQEKERQFDLEIPNPHQYIRNIKVNIPAGYKVNNADKLKMNVVATVNGKESCKFVSDYTLSGNVLSINVFEIYHESFTPKSEYENYRKVINAAADFNKIVIVLEKI
ncbi:MAG: DUF3857 domain-containing protein [Chitinophagaceae bacterium]|nr:DUF3857 domain-containing protein [Chitinophagaceae bacterium]